MLEIYKCMLKRCYQSIRLRITQKEKKNTILLGCIFIINHYYGNVKITTIATIPTTTTIQVIAKYIVINVF